MESRNREIGNWIFPEDPEYGDWDSLTGIILVMTTDGLELVEIEENDTPRYRDSDMVYEKHPYEVWCAWARIKKFD